MNTIEMNDQGYTSLGNNLTPPLLIGDNSSSNKEPFSDDISLDSYSTGIMLRLK